MFLSVLYVFSETSIKWQIPNSVVGKWSGYQKVSVRNKKDHHFVFINAPELVQLSLEIGENGKVTGFLGNAVFTDCEISKNRGWMGRFLNIKTDYIITGTLNGAIFPEDPILLKKISMPFNSNDNHFSGSLFQKVGIDVYPISGLDLVKIN